MGAESEGAVLHGVIVASSKVSHISYILPASNIFEDIKTRWGDEIHPTDQILSIYNAETSTTHLSTDIPVSL